MTSSSPEIQTVVQVNIYRERIGQFEYLLLKRIDEDKDFWQVVTEPMTSGDTIPDALRRAVEQQIGLRGFKKLGAETYSYEWYAHDHRGRDIVFAAELRPEAEVFIDHSRFEAFAWLPADEAIAKLKWSGNKEALRRLHHRLQTERNANPLPPVSGLYPSSKQSPAPRPDDDGIVRNPYGPNVSKRLPDRPEDHPKPRDSDSDDIGFFL